ncbi:MAG: hypothetical protein AABZ60_25195 [Planctomycetota bacterium]
MISQHLQECSSEKLVLFLREELDPEEMKLFWNHYHRCQPCKQWINELQSNESLLTEAEILYQKYLPDLQDFVEISWENDRAIAEHLSSESGPLSWNTVQNQLQKPLLQLFSGNRLIWTESLQSRAAGISETLPNVELPTTFVPNEQVLLVFEEDPVDHSLNIGLKGSSARMRLATQLRISYPSGESDVFNGKDIALGSMWSVPFWKAKKIQKLDLIHDPV